MKTRAMKKDKGGIYVSVQTFIDYTNDGSVMKMIFG
jgi:hypothetical protein